MTRQQLPHLLALVVGLASQSVQAKSIPETFEAVSDYCGVPARILYAVALAESGRVKNKRFDAWPWTLNISGKGQYFETRADQYTALMAAIRDGKSVDIGSMQLNWKWQFHRLHSAWQATDPTYNVITGCNILKSHFSDPSSMHRHHRFKDWRAAVERYHSPGSSTEQQSRAQAYANRVHRQWEKLKGN